MTRNQITISDWLRLGGLRLSRVHFFYVAAFSLQTILYDAWGVVTPSIVLARWIASVSLLAVVTIVWYLAHNQGSSTGFYRRLILTLVMADIAIATFGVYTGRGMASRAVFLYAIPIIVSAMLLSRAALFATATLSLAAYATAAIVYFATYFNEGYKAELYGEVGFYGAGFFLLAGLLAAVIRFKDS